MSLVMSNCRETDSGSLAFLRHKRFAFTRSTVSNLSLSFQIGIGASIYVKVSPKGNYLLLYDNSNVEVWDVELEQLIGKRRIADLKADFAIPAFAFSVDESVLAIPSTECIEVWDVAKCEKVSEWQSDDYNVARSVAWSSDGSRLFVDYFRIHWRGQNDYGPKRCRST